MDDLSFDSIGEEETIRLERPFKEDELFEVVKAKNSDKAKRLDSFIRCFSKLVGSFLVDIMSVFHEFHTRHLFGKNFNATLITLIQKKPGTIDIRGSTY